MEPFPSLFAARINCSACIKFTPASPAHCQPMILGKIGVYSIYESNLTLCQNNCNRIKKWKLTSFHLAHEYSFSHVPPYAALNHLPRIAATSAPAFGYSVAVRSGQRDLVIDIVLSMLISPNTSNSYSMPSRWTGASPTLRGTAFPRSFVSTTYSVLDRIVAMI